MSSKTWIENNRERYLETSRAKAKRHAMTLKGKFTRHRAVAKTRGIDTTLTVEQFCILISIDTCHWCGGKLLPTRAGFDRVDNNLPYTFENCVPCCRWCNNAKNTLTGPEFLQKVRAIAAKFVL